MHTTDFSIYPTAIDGYAQLPLVIDRITPVDADSVNALRSAIINIEKELGALPSGVNYDTVRERLDALEFGLNSILLDLEEIRQDIEELQDIAFGSALPDTINEQYAVLMEDPGDFPVFQRLRESMILPDFDVETFSLDGSTLIEVGDTLLNPSFTATYNLTPLTASVIDDQGGSSADVSGTPNAFSYTGSYTENTYDATVSWTLTAADDFGNDVAVATKRWVQKVFYGVGPAGGSTEAFIEALSGQALATSRNRTFSVTAGATEKIYYAYRSAYGDATFAVGGFDGGFFKVSDTISVTNAFGFTENYTLYESDNLGLGSTTVVVD